MQVSRNIKRGIKIALPIVIGLGMPYLACAQSTAGLPAFNTSPGPNGGTTYSLSVQTMLLLTMLSFLSAMVLMMTSFTRIIIVLSLLRQALGTQSTPPNQVIVGLALFLSFFVMSPILDKAYNDAYKPFSEGQIAMEQAITRSVAPFKQFMLKQTRESDLAMFARISHAAPMNGPEDVPLSLLVPSFVTSELSDRLHDFHSVSHHRYRGGERAHVDGHDDGLAHDHRAAVQTHAVRARRWLAVADRLARAKLRLLRTQR